MQPSQLIYVGNCPIMLIDFDRHIYVAPPPPKRKIKLWQPLAGEWWVRTAIFSLGLLWSGKDNDSSCTVASTIIQNIFKKVGGKKTVIYVYAHKS